MIEKVSIQHSQQNETGIKKKKLGLNIQHKRMFSVFYPND